MAMAGQRQPHNDMGSHTERGAARERIVTAAYDVLAEQGFEATTVKQIAERAGVARGLLHYYFTSKDDLFKAVLEMASSRYQAELQRMIAQTVSSPLAPRERIAAALETPMRRVAWQPEWYRMRYELLAMGLRKPAMLPGVSELLAGGRAGIASAVEQVGAGGLQPADHLAAVLLAAFDGLAVQKLADPAFDLEGAYRMLTRMVEAMYATPPAGQTAPTAPVTTRTTEHDDPQ